jgi:putative tryptophan/tyrosine transport system substrate-binding protein
MGIKMNRNIWANVVRVILFFCCAITLVCSFSCGNTAKVYKVGVLSGLPFFMPAFDGFKEKMTAIGYEEGKKIVYDVANLDVDMAAYEAAAKKFVADKVDLIFAFPTEAAMICKKAIEGTKISLVFALSISEDTGIVKSVREPGGNTTGVRFPSVEISSRRFDVLMRIKPTVKNLFVPVLKDYPSVPSQSKVVAALAKQSGVTIEEVPFVSPPDLAAFLEKRKAQKNIKMDAILCYAEPISITPPFMAPVIAFAEAQKIPLSSVFMPGGPSAVIHVMLEPKESGVLAASLADKVFKGADAGTIPLVTPENYLKIDFALAKKIGLTVPDSVLKEAVEVIR